jgi:hypothetical protein
MSSWGESTSKAKIVRALQDELAELKRLAPGQTQGPPTEKDAAEFVDAVSRGMKGYKYSLAREGVFTRAQQNPRLLTIQVPIGTTTDMESFLESLIRSALIKAVNNNIDRGLSATVNAATLLRYRKEKEDTLEASNAARQAAAEAALQEGGALASEISRLAKMTLAQHVKEKTAKPVANAFWTLVRTVGPDDRKVYDNLIGVFNEFINVKDSADRFMGKVVANQLIADTMFVKAIAEYRKGNDVNPLFLTKRVGLSNTWGKAVAENKTVHDAAVRPSNDTNAENKTIHDAAVRPSNDTNAEGIARIMSAKETIVAALESELNAIKALTEANDAEDRDAFHRKNFEAATAKALTEANDAADVEAVRTGTADAATQERVRARLGALPVDNRAAAAAAKAAAAEAATAKAAAAEAATEAAAENTRDMELREAERNVTKLFTGLRVGSAKDTDFPFVLKLPQIKSVINTQEPDTGKTLLMYATEQLMRDAVERLILTGAKTDLIDSGRRSAFHYIARAPESRAMYVKAPPPAPSPQTPTPIQLGVENTTTPETRKVRKLGLRNLQKPSDKSKAATAAAAVAAERDKPATFGRPRLGGQRRTRRYRRATGGASDRLAIAKLLLENTLDKSIVNRVDDTGSTPIEAAEAAEATDVRDLFKPFIGVVVRDKVATPLPITTVPPSDQFFQLTGTPTLPPIPLGVGIGPAPPPVPPLANSPGSPLGRFELLPPAARPPPYLLPVAAGTPPGRLDLLPPTVSAPLPPPYLLPAPPPPTPSAEAQALLAKTIANQMLNATPSTVPAPGPSFRQQATDIAAEGNANNAAAIEREKAAAAARAAARAATAAAPVLPLVPITDADVAAARAKADTSRWAAAAARAAYDSVNDPGGLPQAREAYGPVTDADRVRLKRNKEQAEAEAAADSSLLRDAYTRAAARDKLLFDAATRTPPQGGKRRRHKTPKRRRARKSTFRRRRKH